MFVAVDDHVLHCDLSGEIGRPALVLLHSLGTSAAVWSAQVAEFQRDFRIVRPDFRGHGLSEISTTPVTIESLASDVLGILDALEIESFHLSGISIGGLVAQAVRGRAPERVRSMTLFDTSIMSASPRHWLDRAATCRDQGLGSIADHIVSTWMTAEAYTTPEGRGLTTMLSRTPDEGYASLCDALADADCRPHATPLGCPTTVAVGEHDQATPRAAAEQLAAALGDLPVQTIAGAAHIPLYQAAAQVNDILRDTIRQATAARGAPGAQDASTPAHDRGST